MKKEADASKIIDCLNSKYGIATTQITLLPLGADMDASVYKAEADDEKSYFIKVKKGHQSNIGVTLLAFLQASGIQQIIPPIQGGDGKLTHPINDFTLIVYPFINGQNGFSCHLNDVQWINLGQALKQVHQLDVPQSFKDQIKKEDFSSKSRETLRSIESMDGNFANDEMSWKLQTFMKEHKEIIHRLVNQAELLCQMIQGESTEFVLCHSDIHGGNVLIDENGAIYIVDWDEPIMAPKERDLMFIGGGVANVWNHLHEEQLFYKGYGKTPIQIEILAYYRHERIIQDIVEYYQALLFTSDRKEDKQKIYKHFLDMFAPNGVVDIAFRTAKKLKV